MRGDKVRIHLNLYEEDVQFLRQRYGDAVGISGAVRAIVRDKIKQLQRKAESVATPIGGEIDFDDMEIK